MYNLIELTEHGAKKILINPAHVVRVMVTKGSCVVFLSVGGPYAVSETAVQIQKKFDQSRLIYSNETIPQCERNVKDMTPEELSVLSDRYIGEKDEFADFDTFWNQFLSDDPDVKEVYELMILLQDWGYQLEEEPTSCKAGH